MKIKKAIILGFILAFVSVVIINTANFFLKPSGTVETENISVKHVSSEILANGKIASQQEVKLQFQTSGKLIYLPFKEGESVYKGQAIASLDTSIISSTFRQAQQDYNAAKAVVEQVYDQTGRVSDLTFAQKVTQTAAEAVQNKAYDSMIKAQTDLNNANLVSPITGVLFHEDVTISNQNITPLTSFLIEDPNQLIFRAQVLEQDIDYVSVGQSAQIYLNGSISKVFSGTVVKIYPQKITLSNGQNAYQAEIKSEDLENSGRYDQTGFVKIKSNSSSAMLVPSWTVLNDQYLWVDENGAKKLKKVNVGKIHGQETEILGGLNNSDKVILNPESIIDKYYNIL